MTLEVYLWERLLGRIMPAGYRKIAFEYDPNYDGPCPSPLKMPMGGGLIFGELDNYGFPGLITDALPDNFGNSVWSRWSFRNKIDRHPFTQLQYLSEHGWGALSFRPRKRLGKGATIFLKDFPLIKWIDSLKGDKCYDAFPDQIYQAGWILGGTQEKIAVGIHPNDPAHIVIGDVKGFEPWILKVPQKPQLGRIEHAYQQMASRAGIEVSPSRLIEHKEDGVTHVLFATKRFDRNMGEKVHVHTLCGLEGLPSGLSHIHYQEFLSIAKMLTGRIRQSEEVLRRTIFNFTCCNGDDHTKNHAFIMDRQGEWRLSPAYDLTLTSPGEHCMVVADNGLPPTLTLWRDMGEAVGIKRGRIDEMYEEVLMAVRQWPAIAMASGLEEEVAQNISKLFVL